MAALIGCEASQISWANHFHAVQLAVRRCLTVGGVTLLNGAAVVGYTLISLLSVFTTAI